MDGRAKESKGRNTRVMATGTFDIIHPGHIYYLSKSKDFGDELHVVIARDSTPHMKPIIPEDQRKKVVESLKPVNVAYLGSEENKLEPVKKINPDVITIGPDQKWDPNEIKEKISSIGKEVEVIVIDEYVECEFYSTSEIIKEIKNRIQ